ncbi:MAG: hypothetical protein AB7K71_41455 [Polyangiaceae bacterium]
MLKLYWLCGLVALSGAACSSTSTTIERGDGGAGGAGSGGAAGAGGTAGQAAAGGTAGTGGNTAGAGGNAAGGSAGQATGGDGGSAGNGGGCSTALADCAGDSCPVEELYTGLGTISGLAVAASQIYFTHSVGTNSVLVRAPKAGGCPEVIVDDLASAGSVRDLANDTDSVWVATSEVGRQVIRVDKDTLQANVMVNGSFCDAPRPLIAQNSTRLFFTCASSGGFIGRLDKLGGAPEVHVDPVGETLLPTSLAASDNWVFFADGSSLRVDTTDGSVGGTVTIGTDIERVAVGLSGLYAQHSNEVWRTGPDGSVPELFIPNLAAVSNFAAQAGIVLASDNKDQSGERVIGRGEQLQIARIYSDTEGRVTALGADAKYVYWAASGTIRRRAR